MRIVNLPTTFPSTADFEGIHLLAPQADGKNLVRFSFNGTAQRWVCHTYLVEQSVELEQLYGELGEKSEKYGLIEPKISLIPQRLNNNHMLLAQVAGWTPAEPEYIQAVKNLKQWAKQTGFGWEK